jgi:hypothetical protein
MFEDDFFKDFDKDFRKTQRGIFAMMGVILFLYILGFAGLVTLTVILLEHFKVI